MEKTEIRGKIGIPARVTNIFANVIPAAGQYNTLRSGISGMGGLRWTRLLVLSMLILCVLCGIVTADDAVTPFANMVVNSSDYASMIYRSQELVLSEHVGGSIDIQNADRLQTLQTTLHLVPIDDFRQTVSEQNYSPQPQSVSESDIIFKWSRTVPQALDFGVDSVVRTRNVYMQVTRTVPYPIPATQIPDEALSDLQFTGIIDHDDAIANKARELAASSGAPNDLFAVSFSVADWVSNNIQYDLQTLTADVTKNATWVYQQRRGVCDELSVLYISMMRSLGVPARFVSGISYTNSPLFSNPWNPHAWVEVYFPQYGWVPFDLTYKQFGYIDAGHIAMQSSVDANDSATEYSWQGFGLDQVKVNPSDLSFGTTLIDARSQVDETVAPNVTLLRDAVSLSSSSALVITLQNLKNYYVSAQLEIAAPAELRIPSGHSIELLLRPFEEKTLYIPVSIAPGLSTRYTYQFPIAVTNFYRALANTTLSVAPSNPTYSSDEIAAIIQNEESAARSLVSETIHPQCGVAPAGNTAGGNTSNLGASVLVNTTVPFICEVSNDGSTTVHDARVCVNMSCISGVLPSGRISSFAFNLSFNSTGIKEVPVRLQWGDITQEAVVDVTVIDLPKIRITTLESPSKMRYDESAQIRLLLSKESFSIPQRTVVRIFDGVPYVWNVGQVGGNKELAVTIQGSQLHPGQNTVPIHALFSDATGVQYSYDTTLPIELYDVTLTQRILIWLKDLLS